MCNWIDQLLRYKYHRSDNPRSNKDRSVHYNVRRLIQGDSYIHSKEGIRCRDIPHCCYKDSDRCGVLLLKLRTLFDVCYGRLGIET